MQPKVILTCGGLGFKVVQKYFNIQSHEKTLKGIIESLSSKGRKIQIKDTIIIPNFHPASYTSPVLQKEIWSTIWEVDTAIFWSKAERY